MQPRPSAGAVAKPPKTSFAVARFMFGSLLAISVIVVGGFYALRAVAIDKATDDTKELVVTESRLVELAGFSDGLLAGRPRALAKLDDVIQGQVLGGSIVRVKVWTRSGRILYSDDPRLIGKTFDLGPRELALFDDGGATATLSDLDEPENVYERPEGKLLEAHTVVRLRDGTPVLFEVYQRFSSVSSSGERLLRALAPPLIAGLVVLLLVQMPLAWGMSRRLTREHEERESLLRSAVEASSRERRRIAADLHDGVVQDLAGIAFGLAPIADEARRVGDRDRARVVEQTVNRLRQGVRDLRGLLVEIHPPTIAATGLKVAIDDLLAPLHAAGIETGLHIDDEIADGTRHDELLYRAAREAIHNAHKHAEPSSVTVEVVSTLSAGVRLSVVYNGRGSDETGRAARRAEGHMGLQLLADLAARAGGTLDLRSAHGEGTSVRLELPA